MCKNIKFVIPGLDDEKVDIFRIDGPTSVSELQDLAIKFGVVGVVVTDEATIEGDVSLIPVNMVRLRITYHQN
jgi:hypothetical protein